MGNNALPYNGRLKPQAQELRKNATSQENHLWYVFLRKYNPRFSRQRIIGSFIVDFFCYDAMLAIELDGSQHYTDEALAYDEERTAYLSGLGIKVLRFPNNAIDNEFYAVCEKINEAVKERTTPPSR
ncbi:MAG TPA: endonuclease domain-containing protein [Clostridiales bacterium]|jgi:very-short-patch-repair endonuclease|nr:endonuclease domain-containing protein [Clostridiales bacterium]